MENEEKEVREMTEDEMQIFKEKQKLEAAGKRQEEIKALLDGYKNQLDALKNKPYEYKTIEGNYVMTMENLDLQIKKNQANIAELMLRREGFKFLEGKARLEFEKNDKWMESQKKLMDTEIDLTEFNIRCQRKSEVATKSNYEIEKRKLSDQEKRCKEQHRFIIKTLKEKYRLNDEELKKMKSACKSPCCR